MLQHRAFGSFIKKSPIGHFSLAEQTYTVPEVVSVHRKSEARHVEVKAECGLPRIFDNETWRKPLRFAADAGGYGE
jgi:hypothetical protein